MCFVQSLLLRCSCAAAPPAPKPHLTLPELPLHVCSQPHQTQGAIARQDLCGVEHLPSQPVREGRGAKRDSGRVTRGRGCCGRSGWARGEGVVGFDDGGVVGGMLGSLGRSASQGWTAGTGVTDGRPVLTHGGAGVAGGGDAPEVRLRLLTGCCC